MSHIHAFTGEAGKGDVLPSYFRLHRINMFVRVCVRACVCECVRVCVCVCGLLSATFFTFSLLVVVILLFTLIFTHRTDVLSINTRMLCVP